MLKLPPHGPRHPARVKNRKYIHRRNEDPVYVSGGAIDIQGEYDRTDHDLRGLAHLRILTHVEVP